MPFEGLPRSGLELGKQNTRFHAAARRADRNRHVSVSAIQVHTCRKTSSASKKASWRGVASPTTSSSRSLGMTMSVSTFFLRVSMPSCACKQSLSLTFASSLVAGPLRPDVMHQKMFLWHTHLMTTSSAFKCEGICHNTHSEDASIFRHTGNYRCCSCTSTSSHACCDKDLQKVFACFKNAGGQNRRCS